MVIKELNENANRNTQVSHQSLPDVDGENTKDVTKLHQFHGEALNNNFKCVTYKT